MVSTKVNLVCILVLYFIQLYFGKCQGNLTDTGTKLRYELKIISQHIEEVPGGYEETKTLDLSYNSLKYLPGHAFTIKNYSSLEKIDMNNNVITNISVDAFQGLKSLKELDLSTNNITTIDSYTFKQNPKLSTLILTGNRIKFHRLQTFLISRSLEYLVLTNNNIEQVYDLTFLMLPNLRSLSLSHNKLTMLAGNSFKPLINLRYLSLADSRVDKLTQNMFSKLPRSLSLDRTPLAMSFDPPLGKVRGDAVKQLLILFTITF